MSYQEYLPKRWARSRQQADHPLLNLRKAVDNLFDDFGDGFFNRESDISIRSNLSETDTDFCVTAELPGLTDADVDVSVTGDRIVIKGEKRDEKDEKGSENGREFHRIERTSGSFQRHLTLPFKIDPDTVKANVKDGVLTVTIPKPPEALEETKKIKVAHVQ